MNPLGLKKAIETECEKANLKVTVAAVFGDDLTVWFVSSCVILVRLCFVSSVLLCFSAFFRY